MSESKLWETRRKRLTWNAPQDWLREGGAVSGRMGLQRTELEKLRAAGGTGSLRIWKLRLHGKDGLLDWASGTFSGRLEKCRFLFPKMQLRGKSKPHSPRCSHFHEGKEIHSYLWNDLFCLLQYRGTMGSWKGAQQGLWPEEERTQCPSRRWLWGDNAWVELWAMFRN